MRVTDQHPALQPGNVAVITGAAGGIGFAAAQRFASIGMRVCLADYDAEKLAEAASQLGDTPEIFACEVDVANIESVRRLAESVRERFGDIALLMNNAGTIGGGDAISNLEGWQRVLSVNLLGVVHGVQTFVPDMIAAGKPGLVINTGSKQGITQPPGDTAYNVSKSGVKSLTEGLAHTLRHQTEGRISAHLLVPGFTYTGMIARFVKEKPPSAWTPDQVVEELLEAIGRGDFYILCPDNDTTREQDIKRIAWTAGDMIENRPALSRWHPDYEASFQKFMDDD